MLKSRKQTICDYGFGRNNISIPVTYRCGMSVPAIFLDRDGTINRHRSDYVKNVDELLILSEVEVHLRKLKDLGFKLIIISNQSAINRKLTTIEDIEEIHRTMLKFLHNKGCDIDGIYFCPHRPEENCDCRKPKIGLFTKAAIEHNVDLSRSWIIGDNETDVEPSKTLGCRAIKIETNGGLAEAAEKILLNCR